MSSVIPLAGNISAHGISASNGGIALAGHVSIHGGMNVQVQQSSGA